MSRYSPTVLPDPGPDIGAGLVVALERARQMRRESEDRQRANRLADVTEFEHGVRHGTAPAGEPSTVTTTREVQDAAQPSGGPFRRDGTLAVGDSRDEFDPFARGATHQVTETRPNPASEALAYALGGQPRYQDLGHGYYVDRAASPGAQAAANVYARNRDAYQQLRSADPGVGAFIPGYDYTAPLAEALKTNQTLRVEGVKHGHDLERVGVEEAGRDRRTGLELGERRYEHETVSGNTRANVDEQRYEHATPSGSTVYTQSQENYRHNNPSGANAKGRGGITFAQALERATAIAPSTQRTGDDGTITTGRDAGQITELAQALFDGDRTLVRRLTGNQPGMPETLPAARATPPAHRARQLADTVGGSPPARAASDSVSQQRSAYDRAAASLKGQGRSASQIQQTLGARP